MVKLTDEEKKALLIVQDGAYSSDFAEKWESQKHKFRDHDFGGDEEEVDKRASEKAKELRDAGWKVRKSCTYSDFARTYMCRVTAIKRRGIDD